MRQLLMCHESCARAKVNCEVGALRLQPLLRRLLGGTGSKAAQVHLLATACHLRYVGPGPAGLALPKGVVERGGRKLFKSTRAQPFKF